MNLERALETQRVSLLRLVEGWIAMLRVLSVGPLAVPVPRWVRAFFDTVLIRAELAVQYMVHTSAVIQGAGDVIEPAPVARSCRGEDRETPSAQALLRRMKALCDVLDTLSRHARRLIRVRKRAGLAFDYSAPSRFAVARICGTIVDADWTAPRVERPPDKGSFDFNALIRTPLAMRAGGVGR